MTKKERAQVVLFLRCTADCGGMFTAYVSLGVPHRIYDIALQAAKDVDDEAYAAARRYCVDVWPYKLRRLEAAQRVEEGSYP